ncbi:MAG TPA: DNA polymerase III subunit gamma/tau [Chitinispirillaceae bacterium]|jgi:DNA polymerase-3 subunit gamma/tau|nr:DNA polymerase III subunit gamma/tau [Chitinispirillaceae bacterium]
MSYIVFARKWRPKTFDDVVGQEHITNTLKKAIEKNRVAHAYIFSGTRGVGKTTTARILARALNCEKGPTPEPCGECTNCKNILSGSSFDVLEIDGASNNGVDDIRELRDNIGYSSMGGNYRIFVIDEVHMLTKSAFNALLKTLEEPPKNVIFIFATTEPQKIPATIHSRCQRYDFRRISVEQVLGRLVHICESEKIAFEKSALTLVARKAEGSMRDALSLLDQVYSFCQENITEKEARTVLGLVETEVYERVMDSIASKDPAPALKAVQDILYQGFDLQEFILGFQEHLRNLLFSRVPGALESRGIDLETDMVQKFSKSAERFSDGDLLRMSEIVKKAEQDIKWSSYPRFTVEIMLIKLVYMDNTVLIEQLIKSLNSSDTNPTDTEPDLKKKIETPEPVTQAPPEYIAPPVESSIIAVEETPALYAVNTSFEEDNPGTAPVDLKKIWPSFLDSLLRDRPNLGSFLSLAYIASSTDNSIDLKFPANYKFQFSEVTKKNNRNEISKLLDEFTHTHIDLRIALETKEQVHQEQNYIKQIGNIPSTINDQIEKEPIIQVLLDCFDGEIL